MKNAQQHILTAAALLVAAGATCGQVSPGDFAPEAVEDYEGTPGGRTVLSSLFGGEVPVIAGAVTHNSVDSGDWSDFRSPGGPIQPSSGSKFGVAFGFGDFTLDFTGIGGITGFQGWASAAGVGDDTIEFFDIGGAPIGSFIEIGGFGPGDGSMERFSFVSTVPIGSVRLTGRETAYDDLGYLGGSPAAPLHFGLPHRTLGDAQLQAVPEGLLLTGLGSSGEDGVAVDLGEAESHTLELQLDLGSGGGLPDGAWLESTVLGVVDGVADSHLYSIQATAIGDDLVFSMDSRLDFQSLRLEARLDGVTVAETTVPMPEPGDPIFRMVDWGHCSPQWFHFVVKPTLPTGKSGFYYDMRFHDLCPLTLIQLPFAGGPAFADKVIITFEDVASDVTWGSGSEVRSSQIPQVLILDEALGLFGFEHRALGRAQMLAHDGELTVSRTDGDAEFGINAGNAGNSGNAAHAGNATTLRAVDLSGPGTHLSLRATGVVAGVPGTPLGVSTADATSISADFSEIGGTRAHVVGMLDGRIVGDVLVDAGGAVLHAAAIPPIDGCGKQPPFPPYPFPPYPCFVWTFAEAATVTPVGGAPMLVDEVRILAADASAPVEALDSFTILAGGMDRFTITDLALTERCRVDLDGDGSLTIFDFLAFSNLFSQRDPRADFDGDGEFTIFDFLAFNNEFSAGCP